MKANPLYSAVLTAPDATYAINTDNEYSSLYVEVSELEKKLNEPISLPDTADLIAKKRGVISQIDELKKRLANKDIIERNNQRIQELEKLLRSQSEELAQLEGIEFTMANFSKARIEAMESRINGLFSVVRFKMFEKNINGGEDETCEATVNGVPYSDINNAMAINAGLDIINAICKSERVTAPIFIDNAESVNQLLHTQSQMIRLVVTDDDTLTIQ